MEKYIILKKGINGNSLGSTGITTNQLEVVNTPSFNSPVEAKTYMTEQQFPGREYLIVKIEVFNSSK